LNKAYRQERSIGERTLSGLIHIPTASAPTQKPSVHAGHKNMWAPEPVFKRQPAGNITLLLRSFSPFAELPGSPTAKD